jgi:hypothetical protein
LRRGSKLRPRALRRWLSCRRCMRSTQQQLPRPAAGRRTDSQGRVDVRHWLPRSTAMTCIAGRSKQWARRLEVAWWFVIWTGTLSAVSPSRQRVSEARGMAAWWLFGSRRQALTLLEHCTASFVLPNVRAEATAEVGSVRLGCESAPWAAAQPYAACRSGSARARG